MAWKFRLVNSLSISSISQQSIWFSSHPSHQTGFLQAILKWEPLWWGKRYIYILNGLASGKIFTGNHGFLHEIWIFTWGFPVSIFPKKHFNPWLKSWSHHEITIFSPWFSHGFPMVFLWFSYGSLGRPMAPQITGSRHTGDPWMPRRWLTRRRRWPARGLPFFGHIRYILAPLIYIYIFFLTCIYIYIYI